MVKQVQSEKDRQRGTQKQLKALQLMILLLPRENAVLLECLLDLLHRAANTPENKMSASSLGVVFAPSLLCPRKVNIYIFCIPSLSGVFSPLLKRVKKVIGGFGKKVVLVMVSESQERHMRHRLPYDLSC